MSADGSKLFLRTAPGQPELTSTGRASNIWVVDTATLHRVADVHLPAPAFDVAPTPDGSAVLASTMSTDSPDRQATWLFDVASGHELAHWPRAICCLELWPFPSAPAVPVAGR